ncbi:MAG TPA: class I SAM-dependent methyltransferase [Blastocatellia bacterium]|nr:class I SAM-dependent methyltransferase [Blastocatellia bacterium]
MFSRYELSYVECADCETVYVNPRPTPAILENYYATSEGYAYWNAHIFPASEAVRREKIFRPRAEWIVGLCRRYGVNGGTLLEVGGGFGTFCQEARRMGFFDRLIAVEPTPDLAETCRRRGLEVVESPVENFRLGDSKADVVVSFEVIEHLFSPGDFVNSCARMLAPGGLLFLTCPNIKGFDVATLEASSATVDWEHLNYFHPQSLAQLVNSSGFDVLEVTTPGKLDAELVRKKALEGLIDLSRQPFLRTVLLDRWAELGAPFQSFLAENGLSSHLRLAARWIGGEPPSVRRIAPERDRD